MARILDWLGLVDPKGVTDLARQDFALARVWYGFMTARVMIAAVLLLLQA